MITAEISLLFNDATLFLVLIRFLIVVVIILKFRVTINRFYLVFIPLMLRGTSAFYTLSIYAVLSDLLSFVTFVL